MKSLLKFRVNLELFLFFFLNNYWVKYFRVTVNCSLSRERFHASVGEECTVA